MQYLKLVNCVAGMVTSISFIACDGKAAGIEETRKAKTAIPCGNVGTTATTDSISGNDRGKTADLADKLKQK